MILCIIIDWLFPHQTAQSSSSESEDGSDYVVVAVGVSAIFLIVVLLVGVFLTINLFREKNLIRYGT